MDDIRCSVKDILSFETFKARVLYVCAKYTVIIELDSKRTIIKKIKTDTIITGLENGEITVTHPKEANFYFDKTNASPNAIALYERNKSIVNEYCKRYEPDYITHRNKDGFIELMMKRHNITSQTVHRLIRLYLQSGFDDSVLIDKRAGRIVANITYNKKPGRRTLSGTEKGIIITPEIRSIFEEGVKKFKSGRFKTIKSVYADLCITYFTKTIEIPGGIQKVLLKEHERPTLTQFRNYLNKRITIEEKVVAKTSAREYRNDKRLLLSSNLKNITGPADVWEIDECEIDISLVSFYDPNVSVGRPIVYFMSDVYSRMIVGYSVSFENNSFAGLTNCYLSLVKDKRELCKEFNIDITNEDWPSYYLPKVLRSDYGAEYISDSDLRLSTELNITRAVVTPGSGSLKGQVEQNFHQFQQTFRPLTEHKGLISKRHDSDHKTTSTLNIREFEQMLVSFIVVHNKTVISSYRRSRDMKINNIDSSPIAIWKYGCETFGSPALINNISSFRFSLLKDIKVTLSRRGIVYKGLFYMNYNDTSLITKMKSLGTKTIKLTGFRIDPRDVGSVYYINDNKVFSATLNYDIPTMSEYDKLNLYEYEELYKIEQAYKRKAISTKEEIDIALHHRQQTIIKNSKGFAKSDSHDLVNNRAKEKHDRQKNELIMEQNRKENKQLSSKEEEPIKPMSTAEAFKLFKEQEYEEE